MVELQWLAMLRTIDRYILRETLPMVFLSLLLFTFMLMIPPIMDVAQALLTKGVDGWTVAHLMALLIPQGLGITIPMAVLIGLLMGLGRISGDREAVALQACGVSMVRLLRPVAVLAVLGMIATCYTLIVALPDANQAFREITYRTMAARAEDEVSERVFDPSLPGLMLYVRDVDLRGTGWTEVFLADARGDGPPLIHVANEGRIVLDQENRAVDIVLENGATHRVNADDPATYDVSRFERSVLSLDPDTIFPDGGPQRGLTELTIPELQAQAAEMRASGVSDHNQVMEIHTKFSIPTACLVFAIIALALGVTNRKDGKLASFALGIGVIFAYYVLMFGAKAMAKGALVSPHLAMWLPNIILGSLGLALLMWRIRSTERAVLPWLSTASRVFKAWLPLSNAHSKEPSSGLGAVARKPIVSQRNGISLVRLLDFYVTKQYLQLIALSFVGLLGVFYISTFVDLSDKLFKGQTNLFVMLEYFWHATPQFAYYVLPISALVASLITIGVLTKTSELTVMKACGISLYRVSLPLLFFSLLWSGLLFSMGEGFLADANRRAEELRNVIRGVSVQQSSVLNRRWAINPEGTIYNYQHFDPAENTLHGVSTYRFANDEWRLTERAHANQAVYSGSWQANDVWVRRFADDAGPGAFESSAHTELAIESPAYFSTEPPQADRMNYRELESYIGDLSDSGVDVVSLRVALERKLSFPFVTLILTLIAVPFAVTTGKRGALYGVGIGIVLAISYWVVISVFAAIGSAGLITPLLAAWAPNVMFGGSAVYLLLAVRT